VGSRFVALPTQTVDRHFEAIEMARHKTACNLKPLHKLWLYSLAQASFRESALAAHQALAVEPNRRETTEKMTYEAFAECAVVRYGRPFTPCILPQARAPGAPDPPRLSSRLPDEFVELSERPGARSVHEAVMRLRNHYFAHGDGTEKPFRYRLVKDNDSVQLHSDIWVTTVTPANLDLLMKLATSLAGQLNNEIIPLLKACLPGLSAGQVATFSFTRRLR